MKVPANAPVAVEVVFARETVMPLHESVSETALLAVKPVPAKVTVVPGAPYVGDSVKVVELAVLKDAVVDATWVPAAAAAD